MPKPSFRFKQFTIQQDRCALKVGTDGVLFGAWVRYAGSKRILDIGSGTGVLALIAAQRNPEAQILGLEIDPGSAAQAAENARASPWADRVRIAQADVRSFQDERGFDLILCNPPYYEGYSKPLDARMGSAKHAEELSFKDLLEAVTRLLRAEGRFDAILPLHRAEEFLHRAEAIDLHLARRCLVRYVAHRPAKRMLLEFAYGARTAEEESLTIEESGPFDYSRAYRDLVHDLMLYVDRVPR